MLSRVPWFPPLSRERRAVPLALQEGSWPRRRARARQAISDRIGSQAARLAVTTATRLDVLPDVPAMADFVPGYEASGFAGIGVPKGTPAEIIDRLNKEINAGLADPKIKARIVELGGTVVGDSPAEFEAVIIEATEKWAKVIKVAGIKTE